MLSCYWFVIAAGVLSWLLAWAGGKPKQVRDRIVVIAFFVVYILAVCFRSVTVGADTANYTQYFETGTIVGWDQVYAYTGVDYEYGFKIYSALVSVFGGAELFRAIAGLLAVVPLAVLYYKETESGPLCCAFFLISLLFELFFSGIRQGLAIGMGMISFYFVKRHKLIPFLIIVALASTFHSSAIFLVLLYPLYHARITQKWVPGVLVAFLVIYLAKDILFSQILLPMFGANYVEGYSYLNGQSGQGSLAILFILLAVYSCVMLDADKADTHTLGLRNILLFAAALHMFTTLNPVVCRLNYYFIPFMPLALARINSRAKPSLLSVVQLANFVLPAFFMLYFLFLKDDSLRISPYLTFFM